MTASCSLRRATTVMQHRRRQDRRFGRWLFYGFELAADGEHLTENPAEQQTVALIRQWHDAGVSLRDIADKLNSAGVPAKQGGPWSHVAVHRVGRAA